MTTTGLFGFAAQNSQWLAARQAAIAGNVANANTPGYASVDLAPFEATLQAASLNLVSTNPSHLSLPAGEALRPVETGDDALWDGSHSANTVNLEQEMLKGGSVHDTAALNAGIVKTFHRLVLASTRS